MGKEIIWSLLDVLADKRGSMFPRICNPLLFQSFFLFGARGTGKSTLLKERFGFSKDAQSGTRSQNALYIDLLDADEEQIFSTRPTTLSERLDQLPPAIEWVVIDEIQKVPKLLDGVHQEIERKNRKFALTGSSARKLKFGGANLLAGRASIYRLSPLTFLEMGREFSLQQALSFGTLPRVTQAQDEIQRMAILRSYAQTYLKEEIWAEQFLRRLDTFRKFIEVVAQMNGQILNHASIARDTGADVKTIHAYFELLEDTLLGFHLEAFHSSFRSRLSKKPKFFLFDLGVARALSRNLTVALTPQTSAYGDAFEHFVILEAFRLQELADKDFRLSYLMTKEGVELDLVVERPGQPLVLVEIKSADRVREDMLHSLNQITKDFPQAQVYCLCRERMRRLQGRVQIVPWQEGLVEIFLSLDYRVGN
jgi:predicted AAA+ superfamily ATPase